MPDYVCLKPLHHAPEHQSSQKNFLLELSHRVLLGNIDLCIENLHFGCVLNLLHKGDIIKVGTNDDVNTDCSCWSPRPYLLILPDTNIILFASFH